MCCSGLSLAPVGSAFNTSPGGPAPEQLDRGARLQKETVTPASSPRSCVILDGLSHGAIIKEEVLCVVQH